MKEKIKKNEQKILAIVGGGPRGLSALESLYDKLLVDGSVKLVRTLFFEGKERPGAGHVYFLEQPDTNWLNLSERGLTIPARKKIKYLDFYIPAFPSYQEWAGYDRNTSKENNPDIYPLRSTLGKYLTERYASIAKVLGKEGLMEIIKGHVVSTDWKDDKFEIMLEDSSRYHSDELVLTIGHQPTNNSEQIENWLEHCQANSSIDLITEPYPINNIFESNVLNSESVVALRGFGLAMIDVMRALTIGLGGKFVITDEGSQTMRYVKSGNEPAKIVPFSLNGLPMAPKLLNLEIDKLFFPTDKEKENFEATLKSVAKKGKAKNKQFLINAIIPIVERVYNDLDAKAYPHNLDNSELRDAVASWLSNDAFEHELIVSKSTSPENILGAFVGMAIGKNPFSLDFCIGHVWRHCQPTLYEALSFSNLKDGVIAEIIELDERIKRYSYGPPVASLQQLIALIDIGIITLDFVNDPRIETIISGWELSKKGKSVEANIMINSLLDPPKLLDVNSAIVNNLLNESLVEPVHGELGIETHKNGCVSLPKERNKIPMAVLGRLSKGTLIGVDAILQCFNERSALWAEGVVERISE